MFQHTFGHLFSPQDESLRGMCSCNLWLRLSHDQPQIFTQDVQIGSKKYATYVLLTRCRIDTGAAG